jgi:hypothetical protein
MGIETVVIDVDGSVSYQTFDGLKGLQNIVGGYVECLRVIDADEVAGGLDAWINEEGKLIGLERNDLAAIVYLSLGGGLRLGDYIAGPVAFTGGVDADGETLGIKPAMALKVMEAAEALRGLVTCRDCKN